jgi:alpha-1,6-mannosyltransferase
VRFNRFLTLAGSGLLLLGLTGAGLYAQQQDAIDWFVAIALIQGGVYLLALWLVSTLGGSRRLLAMILGFAAVMRIVVLLAPPYLSTDIYRYLWDGRVIAAGINPYRYIPNDPHLRSLRDPEIFPKINRNNYARTIYPPVAEAIFFLVTRIRNTLTAMKAAMIGFEIVAVFVLLKLLVSQGKPASRIIIYAWHPLPLWEFSGSGHIDAAMIAFITLALWAKRANGAGAGDALTGLALAAGTLTKFFPAALSPALWRRWDWRMPAVFTVVVVLAYLPFISVGWRVFGFLPQYVSEEGFSGSGAGFYLWNIVKSALALPSLSDTIYIVIAGLLLAFLAIFIALRPRPPAGEVGGAVLAGAFMLLLSPHYAWYFAWLLVFACLVPSAALLWLTLTSFLLYLVPLWPQVVWNRHRFLIESSLYVPFIALAAFDLWWRPRERLRHDERTPR